MKVIDFHLHLSQAPDVNKELNILDCDVKKLLVDLSKKLKITKIDKGMVFFLDTRLFQDEQILQEISGLISSQKIDNLIFSIMLNFRKEDAHQVLQQAVSLGIKGIKFHPIHQKILPEDFKRVKEIAILANNKNLIIVVDTHYVGYDCDVYSGLKLAKFILPYIKGPVILAHSGGLKILEALVLALEHENVYLDISFSVPFWMGTSIEQDFAFAIRKVGTKRCLYGSDAPFIDLNFAKNATEKFLIKHRFNIKEREDIFYNTANSLLQKKEKR